MSGIAATRRGSCLPLGLTYSSPTAVGDKIASMECEASGIPAALKGGLILETLGVKVEPGVEHIQNGSELLAIILNCRYREEGIKFFTPDEFSQQLAFMRHPAGKLIAPHVHNAVLREVQFTQEVLFIRKGKVRVDFFDATQRYLESRILGAGDVILLIQGGHGFEVLEELEMIEVKQGPYAGERDKTCFEGRLPSTLRMGPGIDR
jgi:hypothetical protein